MRWISRLVTATVLVTLVVLVVLLIRSKVPDNRVGGLFRTYALFHDGSRIQPGSPVIIAGVRVGDVVRLSIQGRLARIDMTLQDDVQLPAEGTFATRRSSSLFGDSYVEIIPGPEVDGVRMLRSGEPIPHVEEGGSTDTVLRAMDRALPKIDNALDQVHEVMVNGRPYIQGPVRNRLEDADQWLAEGHIEAPLSKADHGLERLENGSKVIADALATTGRTVPDRLARWNARVTDARQGMADMKTRLSNALRDTREGLDRIDKPVDQMAEVMTAINNGEGDDWKGTLGRLVNDKQPGEDIEDLTEAAKEGTANLQRFKAWLGARMEYNAWSHDFRFYATAELRSRSDKFYLIELERSGLGVQDDRLTDAPSTTPYNRREVISDKLRFTAQFGKRFGWLQVRGGIKDSTFGYGADLLLMKGQLRFSADMFGSYALRPRMKLTGMFAVFRSLYILAGIDDALNPQRELPIVTGNSDVPQWFDKLHYGRDFFAGIALQFNDEDLPTLLRLYGALLVGLL